MEHFLAERPDGTMDGPIHGEHASKPTRNQIDRIGTGTGEAQDQD